MAIDHSEGKRGPVIVTLDITEREAFLERFYAAERPVILRKVPTADQEAAAICSQLNARIARDATAEMQALWWDVRPELLSQLCIVPSFVGEMFNRQNAFFRENHVRVWFQGRGHRTPWHYDGHSLHVFNLQLKGRKRWRLVAPETPLMCMPFTSVCLFGGYSLERRRHYEFETDEGDLVFVPRYWYHRVDALDELNININWVLTPKRVPANNPTARREMEVTWLKAKLSPFLPRSARKHILEYAGAGQAAIDFLAQRVSAWHALMRGVKEILKAPLLLPGLLSQATCLKSVRNTNRVMRSLVDAERRVESQSSSLPRF